MANSKKLFEAFPEISTQEWEAVIEKDLKGADYSKRLIWRTEEGFEVRPYYRAEDIQDISYIDSLPDQFPYTRGYKTESNHWNIMQEVNHKDPREANKIAKDALKRGADKIDFNVENVKTEKDLEDLLQGIDLEKVEIQFNSAEDYHPLISFFQKYIEKTGASKDKIRGAIHFDILACAMRHGKLLKPQAEVFAKIEKIFELTRDLKNFKILNVNGLELNDRGATITQELGYVLGMANEYLAWFTGKGVPVHEIARKIQFTLSVGPNYFIEIAKLRSIRMLWSTMIAQYKPECDCAYRLQINSVASSWNKTLFDPYVNILRSTTEGMAAALGGADTIALNPFDAIYKEDNEFSSRINRNIQVILKEESYFDKVVDPAAGSYYIENLTLSIAEHAWKLFQEVERQGGLLKLIESQELQAAIEESAAKKLKDIATRKTVLLGTNQYPNTNEAMLDKIEVTPEQPENPTLRAAQEFEKLRLQTEQFAQKSARPSVYLLKLGNLAMRQARAGFITNFFGCAGYEIVESPGFATVEEGVKAALESKPSMIVVCSSDEEYATLGVEAVQQVKKAAPVISFIVAGNPTESIEQLKAAGVDDFIHIRLNVLETLQKYNNLLLK